MATAFAKFYSAAGTAKVLDIPDGLLPMSNRQTLLFVGSAEFLIAVYLWLGESDLAKLICIVWLGTNFALYRIASILLVVGKPCPCLGSITEKLPLKPALINRILQLVVAYLVFGSLLFLFARWRQRASGRLPENEGLSTGGRSAATP